MTAAIFIGGRFLCLNDDLKVMRATESGLVIGRLSGETLLVGAQINALIAGRLADYAAHCLVSMISIGGATPTPTPISYCTATVDG